MAKRVKWYAVTAPRSTAVTLADGNVKQVHRGGKFKAKAKDVALLLRTRSIRELSEREVIVEERKIAAKKIQAQAALESTPKEEIVILADGDEIEADPQG